MYTLVNVIFEFAPGGTTQSEANRRTRVSPLYTINGANSTKLKTILYWNEFYGRYDTFDFGYGHEAFVEKGCAYSACFATKDRTLLPLDQVEFCLYLCIAWTSK